MSREQVNKITTKTSKDLAKLKESLEKFDINEFGLNYQMLCLIMNDIFDSEKKFSKNKINQINLIINYFEVYLETFSYFDYIEFNSEIAQYLAIYHWIYKKNLDKWKHFLRIANIYKSEEFTSVYNNFLIVLLRSSTNKQTLSKLDKLYLSLFYDDLIDFIRKDEKREKPLFLNVDYAEWIDTLINHINKLLNI